MYSNKHITINDIAELANVSSATVSRILNNKGNVTLHTRKRVFDIMQQLHFKANISISDSDSRLLLMCIPNLENPFNMSVMTGAVESATAQGYKILFCNERQFDKEFSYYQPIFSSCSFAGILLLTPTTNVDFTNDLQIRYPVVICSEYEKNANIPYVSVDNELAAQKAVEHLYSIGKSKIALFNCSTEKKYARSREKGYRDAMKKHNLTVNEDWNVHMSSVDYMLATTYAKQVLSQTDRPDAIFAISDVYAAAIINVAQKFHLRIPDDLAVVGFDDIDLATQTSPSITTVRQPSYQIGYQACEMLIEKLRSPGKMSHPIILDTELIIRESTSAV